MFGGNSHNNDPFRDLDGIMKAFLGPGMGGSGSMSLHSGGPFGSFSSTSYGSWSPAMDLQESPTQYCLHADLPGVPRESMEVNVTATQVCVRGTRAAVEGLASGRRVFAERGEGAFERCFSLPARVREAGVNAAFNDGVLSVHMDKETQGGAPGNVPIA